MTQDNSKKPPEKTIFAELVDATPAYKVIGCLLVVGLVWGFIQNWIILDGGGSLSARLFFWHLGQAFGFVILIVAVSTVIAGINFVIDRDGKSAKRWWAGSYILSGIVFAYYLIKYQS